MLYQSGFGNSFATEALPGALPVGLLETEDMNELMAASSDDRRRLRRSISTFLRGGDADQKARACLVAQAEVEMGVPCRIGDYPDFYVGIHHATAIGKLFRPDNPLLPNYKYVPIGYHGRASTINVSGQDFHRPMGQLMAAGGSQPEMKPSARLDIELELGIFIGRPTAQGRRVKMEQAEEHVFGMALFNDWSARDIQAWEYQPLGPFLSKSFASTVSPWIVTRRRSRRTAVPSSGRPKIRSRCRIWTARPIAGRAQSTSNWRCGCKRNR